jgi:hypothetical protein
MAMLLLKANEGSFVSMELIDDVGVEQSDGSKIASQTKSARTSNPVRDRSPALWKCFANWARDVRSGALDASRTEFELYLSRQFSGNFVVRMDNVETKQQALSAFEDLRTQFWGSPPKFPERVRVPASLAPHLEEVFGPGAAAFRAILPRFRLTCASASPVMDVHNYIAAWLTIPEQAVHDLVHHVHGWLKVRVDEQLETGRAPVIARDGFVHELRAFYGRIAPSNSLPDLAPKPNADDLLRMMPFKFVRQLQLVETDRDSLRHAMTCYFKAVRARTIWGERALVHDSSIDALEEDLKQVWRNAREHVFSDPNRPDASLRGRLLQGRCSEYRCLVESKIVPDYFVPGCFHTLADELMIGWHPDYRGQMQGSEP